MNALAARKIGSPDEGNDPSVEGAFRDVPGELIAEIIDGELHTQPRPARSHTRVASVLGGELYGPFWKGSGGPGGWVILFEPEIHLGPRPDKVVSDLAGWRVERMPDAMGAEDEPAYYDVAPDWVCEILSPGTEGVDRGKKMRIYRREGVKHLWFINPLSQTLEIYRLDEGRWIHVETYEEGTVARAEPFEAIELSLAMLFRR